MVKKENPVSEEKLISVIIPVYNSEAYLEECLDSVVNQTYRNIEIILVNDGSTDRSPEICRCYAQKDDRVVFLSQENGGEAAARNRGLRAAKGELVMFVDSDDRIADTICENAVQEMRDYDLLFLDFCSDRRGEKESGSETKVLPAAKDLSRYSAADWVKSMLDSDKTVPPELNLNTVWAKLYRRDFLEMHGIVCPVGVVIGEDMLFNLQVYLKSPKVCHLPVTAYYYRYNEASVVHRYNPKVSASNFRLQTEIKELLIREQLWDSVREEAGFQQMAGLLQVFSSDLFHRNNPKTEQEKKADFRNLVSREEYAHLYAEQRRKFGPAKRTALFFAQQRLYYPLKVLYRVKDLLAGIGR